MNHETRIGCGRRTSSVSVALALAAAFLGMPAQGGDLAGAVEALKGLGPEGRGNPAAGKAWSELVSLPATDLPSLLAAMDGAGDLARNYLMSAASAIGERELQAGRTLPLAALGEYLLDVRHGARSRRLAYELIERADKDAGEALVPAFIDDPAPDLRREAVQRMLERAGKILAEGRTNAAGVVYRQALAFARDGDQIDALAKPLKDMGRPVNLIEQLGFLVNWRVVGPFDNSGRAGFEKVFPPEGGVKLDAEYDGKEGRVRWKPFTSDHEFGLVDLNKAIGTLKEVAGYAYTEFESESEMPAQIRLGSQNGWKVWFNGRLLFGRDEYHRGTEMDQYRMPVTLKAGRNSLLVKLTQNEEKEEWTVQWDYQLRITDPNGRVIRVRPVDPAP